MLWLVRAYFVVTINIKYQLNRWTYGPFSGAVLDSETGNPIEGAIIYFFVSNSEDCTGMFEPSIYCVKGKDQIRKITYTDSKGLYYIKQMKLKKIIEGEYMKESFQFMVFRNGYLFYSAKLKFPCRERRNDFQEQNNQVSLEPWKESYSYEVLVSELPSDLYWDQKREACDPKKIAYNECLIKGSTIIWTIYHLSQATA